ncbi:MAG: YciI family protein [Candidatus Promineifilaceae bacterium]
MKYMLLIYTNESAVTDYSQADIDQSIEAYNSYIQSMAEAGVFLSAEGLQPTAAATTVRVHNGSAITTHGPFAETTEQLGGYVLIECDNLDQAIEWAGKCPTAPYGSVEIRPVMSY